MDLIQVHIHGMQSKQVEILISWSSRHQSHLISCPSVSPSSTLLLSLIHKVEHLQLPPHRPHFPPSTIFLLKLRLLLNLQLDFQLLWVGWPWQSCLSFYLRDHTIFWLLVRSSKWYFTTTSFKSISLTTTVASSLALTHSISSSCPTSWHQFLKATPHPPPQLLSPTW